MANFLLSFIPSWGTFMFLVQLAVGVAYPAYESFKAIESTETKDDTQWLGYWVTYAVIQTVEGLLWPILRWIPLYGMAKVAVLAWLTVPQYKGATFVYQTYIRPLMFALVEKAREIPAIEPYVRDFGQTVRGNVNAATKKAEDAARAAALKAQQAVDDAPLKAHAQ